MRLHIQFASLWRWLTAPSAVIQDPEQKRRSRLLQAMLVVLIPSGLMAVLGRLLTDPAVGDSTLMVPLLVLASLLLAYCLGRTRHLLLGSSLAITGIFCGVFWAVLIDPSPASVRATLGLLAMVVLMGSLLFSLRGTIILAINMVLVVILTPLVITEVSWGASLTALSFVILMSGLIIVAANLRHQNLHELEQQSQELELLNRVTVAANTTLDPYQVLDVTCRELAQAFDLSHATAALYDDGMMVATVVAEYHVAGRASTLGQVLSFGVAGPAWFGDNKAPIFVPDVATDPRGIPFRHLVQQTGMASLVILPLVALDRVMGVIMLDYTGHQAISQHKLCLAATAAGAAARALEHAQLYVAENQAHRRVLTLSEVVQELNLVSDLVRALDLVLERMEEVIAFDCGAILLLEDERMRVVAVGGPQKSEQMLGCEFDLSTSKISRQVIRTHRPSVGGSIDVDARWKTVAANPELDSHVRAINSCMVVPLLIQDRVIGMLTADSTEPDFYREQDAELAMAFASHAAVAIENARLFESEREQLRFAKTLQAIGALLTTRLSLDEVFEHIFDLLKEVIDYDSVSLQLLDGDGNMELVSGRGLVDMERVREYIHHSFARQTLEERWGASRVAVIPDTHNDERWIAWPESAYIRSWIGAALMVKDQVVGVLNVDSATVDAYSEAMGETVAAFANQAAIAIENARLYDNVRRELAQRRRIEQAHGTLLIDLERRSDLLEMAAEVSRSTSTILDPDKLMGHTVNLIAERFSFYYVGIFLVEKGGANAVLRAATGEAGARMLADGHRLLVGGESMIGWSIANAEPRIALDVGLEAVRFDNPLLPETRSELALPLISRGACIGSLTVQSNQPAAFSSEDVAVLQTVADQVAIAIRNAGLYEDARREIQKRKQAEETVIKLNESLERRVAERTAELAAVNRELEAFAYSVSHDLRAPLRRITGFCSALAEDYSDRLDAVGLDYLRRLHAASQQMGHLIESLLNLARVTQQGLERKPIDLTALARQVADGLRQAEPDRAVTFEIANDLRTFGDGRLLRVVMENLLGNAWKFTSRCDEAQIKVGALWQNEQETAFFVRDNGAGFDMAYAERLFIPFQRLHTVTEFEGAGIGLATVQRIVHRHGGYAWAEGSVGDGATFYFIMRTESQRDE